MARVALTGVVLAGLAGLVACSQNEAGRKVIAERCVKDGMSEQVCKCLADESSNRLDGDMFELVVLGAQGDPEETDLALEEMPRERQLLFGAMVADVRNRCGAEPVDR